MVNKKARKKVGNTTRASVSKEMAKPRMARSARIAELKLDSPPLRNHFKFEFRQRRLCAGVG